MAMTGGGREGERGVSDVERRAPRPTRHRRERGSALRCAAAGSSRRCITVLVAFFVGGLVVLLTGHDPIDDLQGDLRRHRAELVLPVDQSEDDRTIAALNLQQTLILTTPLILTGLAVAFAFRCGLFNIGGQGQYIVGSYRGRLGRLVVRRACRRCCTSCSRSLAAALAGAACGRASRAC